jgi:hypothetical protein
LKESELRALPPIKVLTILASFQFQHQQETSKMAASGAYSSNMEHIKSHILKELPGQLDEAEKQATQSVLTLPK